MWILKQTVRALEGDVSLDDLNEGVKPGQSSVFGSDGSTDYDKGSYNADMKKFRRMALSSQDYESSTEYGFTSDYGNNEASSSASGDSLELGQRRASRRIWAHTHICKPKKRTRIWSKLIILVVRIPFKCCFTFECKFFFFLFILAITDCVIRDSSWNDAFSTILHVFEY